MHKEQRRVHHGPGRRIPGPERTIARRRDGRVCRWCGTDENLNLHHVIYRSEAGPDRAYNLMTLCRKHHEEVHADKHTYQPVLLHMLKTGDKRRVPVVLKAITPREHYEAVLWGRNMRNGQVAEE